MKRDIRKYAKNTNLRLVVGFIVLLFLIGDGLIYLIYGPNAAIAGFLCILGGIIPLLLISGLMILIDIIVKKANDE